ncbi:MAG: dockerin type I repeat-containing protein [Aristaeellaceae bacterium]
MKKRWTWLLTGLVLLLLLCVPGIAGAEAVKTNFWIYVGSKETIQPSYPDFSAQIGEGLTKEDFTITYSTDGKHITVDAATGAVTSIDTVTRITEPVYVTYTPVQSGVGKETVFSCTVELATRLERVEADKAEFLLGMGQKGGTSIRFNDYRVPPFKVTGYDKNVVEAVLRNRPEYCSYQDLIITPVGVGETTVTVLGYNGISVDIHVKVMRAPTKLSFARNEFHCYVGEEISLGIDLGGEDCAPNYSIFRILGYPIAGDYTFKHEGGGLFCATVATDYNVWAETYNGFSAHPTIRVYDRVSAVRLEASKDTIHVGDEDVEILAYDANGKQLRIMKYAVTKGQDIARMAENKLITTGSGEVEVTCTNYDGSTCSQTFQVSVTPTKIILKETEVTLNIGETYEIEVGFDQGEMPYAINWGGLETELFQGLYPVKLEGNVVTAQAPGVQYYIIGAGNLTQRITFTVPESDKAVRIVCPKEPFPVNESYQFYVADKTGKVYPATFTTRDIADYGTLTSGGFFTAKQTGYFGVTATLADGRVLSVNLEVKKVPKWLQCSSVVMKKSGSAWASVTSDVGPIEFMYLTFEVEDESILSMDASQIVPKKVGKTTVTVRSIYDKNVSATFTVEVISDTSEIYIGTTKISVPYGSSRMMPIVYDSKGKEVEMVWKITHENAGEGNPDKSGFTLEKNVISCTWPTASCEVTGTVKNGSKKVKVSVTGFLLPETIAIEPEQVWLELGDSKTLTLTTEDKNGGWGAIYWEVESPSIAVLNSALTENNRTNTVKAVSCGETLVAAVLENGAMAFCLVTVYDPDARLPGDVNEDGKVDARDALIVMQYSAGWPVIINGWQGDVNADGSTNLGDAVRIFQRVSGEDVILRQYTPGQ